MACWNVVTFQEKYIGAYAISARNPNPLLEEKSAAVSHLHKNMEDANVRLTAVVSTVGGDLRPLNARGTDCGPSRVPNIAKMAQKRLRK